MNVRDSDLTARRMRAAGFADAPDEASADIVIVNSCSVREKAEDKALGKLGLLCAERRGGRRPALVVGLTGCMAHRLAEDVFGLVPGLSFSVGPRSGDRIPELVSRCLAGERNLWCPDPSGEAVSGPPSESSTANGSSPPPRNAPASAEAVSRPTSSFVTILYGCNQRCSYCIVPHVRGSEESRDPRAILAEVREEVARGARDICLLGQSVMRYGRAGGFSWPSDIPSPGGYSEPLPRLLEYLARETPGLLRLRFTSGHPLGVTPELVRAMREIPQVCPHLHLPMQSGSDRILRAMRRGYDRARYLDAVRALREGVPEIAITTDVIVGYPGETEEDFEQTRSAMEEAGFDNAFIFKYSPRPGTASAQLPDDVGEGEKRRRDAVLLADQDARGQRINEEWVGRTVQVLCEGPSLRNAARWAGRTGQNKIVVFDPPAGAVPGALLEVTIEEARPQTLYGSAAAPR